MVIIMKIKLKQILTFSMVFIMLFSVTTFASNSKNTNSKVEFYIYFLDDDLIEIQNVGSSLKNNIKLDEDFSVTVGGGVTENTILSYVTKVPDNDKIFKKMRQMLRDEEVCICTADGKIYGISELTEENFDVEWHTMYFDEHWHINGKIVDLDTNQEIIIQDKDDGDDDDQNIIIPKYTNNYAYIFGYNDTQMGPDGSLLRCELSAMIHRLAKQNDMLDGFYYNKSNAPYYSDIEGEWFRSAIEFMAYKGAFAAEKGSNVNPYVAVTRGEAFKLICIGLGFTDDTTLTVDEYAEIMKEAGYIQGDENGDLNVSDLITRAEFCTIYNRVTGRDKAGLVTADGEEITAKTYGFTDLTEDKWYYETMLKATSAYDENGYVDIEKRGIRNNLDDHE